MGMLLGWGAEKEQIGVNIKMLRTTPKVFSGWMPICSRSRPALFDMKKPIH